MTTESLYRGDFMIAIHPPEGKLHVFALYSDHDFN